MKLKSQLGYSSSQQLANNQYLFLPLFEQLFDYAPEAMLLVNDELKIVKLNSKAKSLLKIDNNVNYRFDKFIARPLQKYVVNSMTKIVQGKSRQLDIIFSIKSTEKIPVRIKFTKVKKDKNSY